MKELRPSERREALHRLALTISIGIRIRHNEPLFRHWDKVNSALREKLKQLKSDDIKNDMTFIW